MSNVIGKPLYSRLYLAAIAVVVAACSSSQPSGKGATAIAPAPVSASAAAAACERLRGIIDQEATGFQGLKQQKRILPAITIWSTRPVFDSGKCEIWEWAADKTNYVCSWNHETQRGAQALYAQYRPIIAVCLGDTWDSSRRAMRTGEATRFSSPSESANVYLLYYQAGHSASGAWLNSLIVGDDARLE